MATLSYNDIVAKAIILYNNEPYEVLSSHVFRMQQRKPVNQTKLRHLVSGKVLEISFHQNESVQEAEVGKMEATYLYTKSLPAGRQGGESWFAESGNAKNRFKFVEEAVREQVQWLAPNATVEVLTHDEVPLAIKIPIKVDLKVVEAPPNVKGDTATGGIKLVKLKTGASVQAPLFINTGDVIRINTGTGTYTERVSKV